MYYNVALMSRDIGSRIWPTVIGPRPVYLIVTCSSDGIQNIAPFSSVSNVSTYPPIISVSVSTRNSAAKWTQANIEATGSFSLNIVSRKLASIANDSAVGIGRQDDFERLSLTPRVFPHSNIVGIGESPATVACEAVSTTKIEGTNCTVILARCTAVIIDDECLEDGVLDVETANAVSTIGSEKYISIKGEAFTLPRLWE